MGQLQTFICLALFSCFQCNLFDGVSLIVLIEKRITEVILVIFILLLTECLKIFGSLFCNKLPLQAMVIIVNQVILFTVVYNVFIDFIFQKKRI